MTQEGIIRILPTFGSETLADNERVFLIYQSEVLDNNDGGVVTFKVTTDQLLSAEGFEVKFFPQLFTRVAKQTSPVVVSPQPAVAQVDGHANGDSSGTVKVGELVTGNEESWPCII